MKSSSEPLGTSIGQETPPAELAPRAKVFISCGQHSSARELQTAEEIGRRFESEGFDYYIAMEQQNLDGVKEAIFRQLGSSEYFVFVDFRRERLATTHGAVYRGSLFSHQELAIASYLDLTAMSFQEKGVKREDGIMRYLQANARVFTDKHSLADVVISEAHKSGWKPDWKYALTMQRDPAQHWDLERDTDRIPCRFFHINVKNLHRTKMAVNCSVYVTSIRNAATGEEYPLETVEIKWAGTTMPGVNILPSSQRSFDAVWFDIARPTRPHLHPLTDSGRFVPGFQISGTGSYEIAYLVASENFGSCAATFLLTVGTGVDEFTLGGPATP